MRDALRRIRGALGLGAIWGGLWGVIFAALGLVAWIVDPGSIEPGEGVTVIVGTGMALGLVSGAVFGGLMALMERGRALDRLSTARVALWGALSTAVFPLLTTAAPTMLVFLCPLGAAIAAGSVAMARRAAGDEREFLEDSPDADRLGAPGGGSNGGEA